ncbi:MAG: septum formation protein Maf [Proteobacteria bacterium]|nr:septum formation protein Maf [Pseudomonadota bacterium]
MYPLVLASSSPYRKELLSRLKIPFSVSSPEIDESRLVHETIFDMVLRLSKEKAIAGAAGNPQCVCIGSDVVAAFDGQVLGKPLSHQAAINQLSIMSGQQVIFYTGVCVAAPFLNHEACHMSITTITFRTLSKQMIENYLTKEKPYQSAGSFKSETLGCALVSRFECDDPTAIIGLPLIALSDMLKDVGIEVV